MNRLFTFDRVCLHQLRAIGEKILRNALPRHPVRHSEIDVSRRQFVDMEPHILGPSVLDQVLVYESGQRDTLKSHDDPSCN